MLDDIRVFGYRHAWETCVIFELDSILFLFILKLYFFYGNLEFFFFRLAFSPCHFHASLSSGSYLPRLFFFFFFFDAL